MKEKTKVVLHLEERDVEKMLVFRMIPTTAVQPLEDALERFRANKVSHERKQKASSA